MAQRNARLGLVLFGVYATFYAAFVLASAFAADVMDTKPLFGLNLAVLSGFALIGLALLLALVYGFTASPQDAAEGER